MFVVGCPKCQKALVLSDGATTTKCTRCGHEFTVGGGTEVSGVGNLEVEGNAVDQVVELRDPQQRVIRVVINNRQIKTINGVPYDGSNRGHQLVGDYCRQQGHID